MNSQSEQLLVAVDIGGTFTDLCVHDPRSGRTLHAKSLTTYDDFLVGIDRCFAVLGVALADCGMLKHGTTLVINMLVERRGARAALVTTRGFRDVLEIGRGNRPLAFKTDYRRDPPLIPRELRFECDERIAGDGTIRRALDTAALPALAEAIRAAGAESIAICFINAYAQPDHERLAAEQLRALLPGKFVTCSTDVTREWYEYERTATAAANAFVGPAVRGYLERLDAALTERRFTGPRFLMGSGSGVLAPARAAQVPIQLVESGPVGGLVGAAACAAPMGLGNLIALDVGGTTAKCALVRDGHFELQSTYWIGGYVRGFPIRSTIVDIVEVGAGGGSIAYRDEDGGLHVGPRSAGSTPGPAAYGRGGHEPTVTDANILLGRIDPAGQMGDGLALDARAAHTAVARLGATLGYAQADLARLAAGIISIASVTMAGAIRRITIERGEDPREYVLFAYGGGGPLHAVQLARELAIPTVVVPPSAGTFAALGMLFADVESDATRTFVRALNDDAVRAAQGVYAEMESELGARLAAEYPAGVVVFTRHAELRFRGQMHTVRIELAGLHDVAGIRARFAEVYAKRYGHVNEGAVEIVALRSIGRAATAQPVWHALAAQRALPAVRRRKVWFEDAGGAVDTPVYRRESLGAGASAAGPALIEDYGSTCVIEPADIFTIGRFGEIRIEIGGARK